MSVLSIFGVALVGLVFCDVFATILLARAGGGVISPYRNHLVWKTFLATDRAVNADGRVMAFAGPILLVLIVALWVAIAISGFALMYLPLLGTGITARSGFTATDFATACYYSGFTFSTLGLGDIAPQTTTTKLLTVGEACTGFAVFTMAVSYTLSIYGAVNDRDALALLLHADTGKTDDPSVSLAGLCPGGSPAADAGPSMHALSANLSSLLQTHYSYPLAHYYRRRDATRRVAVDCSHRRSRTHARCAGDGLSGRGDQRRSPSVTGIYQRRCGGYAADLRNSEDDARSGTETGVRRSVDAPVVRSGVWPPRPGRHRPRRPRNGLAGFHPARRMLQTQDYRFGSAARIPGVRVHKRMTRRRSRHSAPGRKLALVRIGISPLRSH